MFKKLTLGVLALAIVGGVLFGGSLLPYVKTAVSKARQAAKQQVPISFQIDAAQTQLDKINPEIYQMVHQIAKEKAQLNRMEMELKANHENLETSYDEMMTLRGHLGSGKEFYTAANSQTYTNARVKEDLAHRFAIYKTAQQTADSQEQVLESRKSAITSALEKLDEAKVLQRELMVQVDNLRARNRVNEVAKTASSIDLNRSEISKAKSMLDDIDAQIAADAEMLQLAPKYFGQIPVSKDSVLSDQDILQEMDEFFGADAESDVVKN